MVNGLLAIFNCFDFLLYKHIYLINVDAYMLHVHIYMCIYVYIYVHTIHLDVYMFLLLA